MISKSLKSRSRYLTLSFSLFCLGWLTPSVSYGQAELAAELADQKLTKEYANKHIRLKRSDSGEVVGLEVSVTRLLGPNKQVLDLISAVHIADEEYFEDLNQRFKNYSSVLYELVLTDAKSDPANIRTTGALQDPIAAFSGFASQLKVIDYTADNLVHADLTADELGQELKASGSSVMGVISSILEASSKPEMLEMSEELNTKLFLAFISPNRTLLIKRVVAELLASSDKTFKQLGGVVSDLLIVKRNLRVLEVLERTLKNNPSNGPVAIFYGAGHNSDLVNRLQKDFGFIVVKTEWLLAWDLKGD